jgi:GntR family transcriptional regulator / MocR family aminotransferase
MIANHLLQSGELDRHLRRVAKRYSAMRAWIKDQLKPLAPHAVLRGDEGGLHVALDCSAMPAANYQAVCHSLHQRGVCFDPIDRFASAAAGQQVVLIGYAHWGAAQLAQSIKLLRQVFKQCG